MTKAEIISKLNELRQIKPTQEWVFLTKQRILNQEPELEVLQGQTLQDFKWRDLLIGLRFVLGHKFAFVSLAVLMVLIGTFSFAQNSMPGDALFIIKRATEKGLAVFVSDKDQPKARLELANKRLNDLTKIAQGNLVENLAPAIKEYKAMASEAAKSINKDGSKKDLEKVKEIVLEVKKLEENKQKIESLGVVLDNGEELNNALAQLIEEEINDLESRTLTEEQNAVLEEIKNDFEQGKLSQTLEKILLLNQ